MLSAERSGGPAIDLETVPRPKPDDYHDVEGLALPRRHASNVFGDGAAAKSYLALWYIGTLARGGLDVQEFAWGSDLNPNGAHRANIWQGVFPERDLGEDQFRNVAPVKSFPPNGYGLYDIVGNVWEWTSDWYAPDYYLQSPAENPIGPAEGQLRVLRGGSWLVADVRMLSCSYRHKVPPDTYSYGIGFRIVCPTR